MRNIQLQERKLEISKKTWKTMIGGSGGGPFGWNCLLFTFYYRGRTCGGYGEAAHYSKTEIKEMILRGGRWLPTLFWHQCSIQRTIRRVPFVWEGFSVTLGEQEYLPSGEKKQPVGCIPYLDSYICLTGTVFFIEGSGSGMKKCRILMGIQVNHGYE